MSLRTHIEQAWEADVLPSLMDFVAIPAVSVHFDPEWKANGHIDAAVTLIRDWCAQRDVAGLVVEVHELPGRTPVILVEAPAANGGPADDTVLLYGHLDKQPEMVGWREDLGPWKPVREGERLYGRGAADDGYAAFASLLAIEAAQRAGLPHGRCIVLIEGSEESGSTDLPAYLHALKDRIGSPSLVLCLDSECLTYDRIWITTSLRGMAAGTLRVDILREGVHSGSASGIVPSSFRIARRLLDRIEDPDTGVLRLPELHAEVPADRRRQAAELAADIDIAGHMPWVDGAGPVSDDRTQQQIARTWEPTLSVIGAEGMPPVASAGNVLRPYTSLQLSVRLPPTVDPQVAVEALERTLTADPPYGAHVTFTGTNAGPGWAAPALAPWLDAALTEASTEVFGQGYRALGEGGSIPFMGMLGELFPDAQFVITGALGPGGNAHGPNEFLHVPTAIRITECLALLLRAHATR
ncbi:MAG: M20/M25/M40 family metallo-hydrolase [Acidimicrobiaceae bacterium]|nr:M20/M25/M40 family metallo-hydrolase [Ilumatobacter sp.]MCB9379586.1 M20/M25/M40 family metallo-hydrolase [Acidimicrobiaceae bacterium]